MEKNNYFAIFQCWGLGFVYVSECVPFRLLYKRKLKPGMKYIPSLRTSRPGSLKGVWVIVECRVSRLGGRGRGFQVEVEVKKFEVKKSRSRLKSRGRG